MNSLVDSIVEILKEKNYNIAAQRLKSLDGLDKFGTENFLHDIILLLSKLAFSISHICLAKRNGMSWGE